MNTTSTIDHAAPVSDDGRLPPPASARTRWRRVGLGGVLVASFAVAGALFWGVPASTGDDDLPDPEQMSLLGDGRNTSAANVEFWSSRVAGVPNSAAFHSQLAAAQLALAGDTGDLAGYEVAEQTARSAVALAPTNETALLTLGSALAGQHDFTSALALAEQVLEDDPDSVGALIAAGDARLELGDYAGARLDYTQVSERVGGKPAVLSRFARLESLTGSLDESNDLARRALVGAGDIDLRHADAAFYWFQLATFEYHRGEYADAERLVRSALRIDSENGGSTELLARVLVARGAHVEATTLYESMVDGGGAADLHGELAKLYRLDGRDDDAAEQVELGLAVAARDADTFAAERRHLIGFLADHDPLEALRLAELDLAERQDIHAHAWYAWSLYQNGRIEAAVTALQPAMAYRTEDAWLQYQAGMILIAAGEREAGAEFLASALDLNPEFDLVHSPIARRALANG